MGIDQGCAIDTILVVDDESGIRQSVRGVLADEGYRVLEAVARLPGSTRRRPTRPVMGEVMLVKPNCT